MISSLTARTKPFRPFLDAEIACLLILRVGAQALGVARAFTNEGDVPQPETEEGKRA
jgi:hypothetical protein